MIEPEIQSLVAQIAREGEGACAAFDADGTVWSGDIGEDFLRELAAHRRLLHPPPGDPYAVYERLFWSDAPRAFAYCVEVMRGLSVADVERWSDDLFQARFLPRIFPGVRHVLAMLREARVRVLLVSASNAVTVRRAAIGLGLDPADVLAVEGETDGQGRFTGRVLEPVTAGEGKVVALRQRLGAAAPAIAFGNSLFDREMLSFARHAVMVCPSGSEGPASELARSRGWPIHRVAP